MKRILAFVLCVLLLFGLAGCGKKKNSSSSKPASSFTSQEAQQQDDIYNQILEVKITPDNLYNYFEYHEFAGAVKANNGETVNSVQISYGLQLRPEYIAANDPDHKDSLLLEFSATGVVNKGEYDVNYDTLEYTGTSASCETESVTGTLQFWAKGNRTSVYPFGNYSSTVITYLSGFTITSAKGTVYLKYAPPAP